MEGFEVCSGEAEVMVAFFIGHGWDGDSGPWGFWFLRREVGSGCFWRGGWRAGEVDCIAWVAAGSHGGGGGSGSGSGGGGLCHLHGNALARMFLLRT